MDSELRTFWGSVRRMAKRMEMESRQKELVARIKACVSSGGREDASQREGITGVRVPSNPKWAAWVHSRCFCKKI